MVVLTEAMIKGKTRLDALDQVRNLNLWGQDIDDMSILSRLPNVEVLSLSINRIKSLRPFAHCKVLRELYLRKNDVSSLEELRFLARLPNLQVLWLSDNPCAEDQDYRGTVVRTLACLEKLDNQDVTPAERAAAAASATPVVQPAGSQELSEDVVAHIQQEQEHNCGGGSSPNEHGATRQPGSSCVAAMDGGRAAVERPSIADAVNTGTDETAAEVTKYETRCPLAPVSDGHCSEGDAGSVPSGGRAKEGSRERSSKNVLYAVMALLPELDSQELELVAREAQRLMSGWD